MLFACVRYLSSLYGPVLWSTLVPDLAQQCGWRVHSGQRGYAPTREWHGYLCGYESVPSINASSRLGCFTGHDLLTASSSYVQHSRHRSRWYAGHGLSCVLFSFVDNRTGQRLYRQHCVQQASTSVPEAERIRRWADRCQGRVSEPLGALYERSCV